MNADEIYRRACVGLQEEIREQAVEMDWLGLGWTEQGYMWVTHKPRKYYYFPSLEWLLDQLKKYARWYMLHWEKKECYVEWYDGKEVHSGPDTVSERLAVLAALGKYWKGWTLKENGEWER